MQTLGDLLPLIQGLGTREAVRWSNGYRTWIATYADLYGRIGTVVRIFDERGLQAGDRVLIWAGNRLEWMATFWACVARGIAAVPVDYRFSPDLVARIRHESQPKLIVDDAWLDSIASLPAVSEFSPVRVTPDDVVEIVYTSGSTGEPKGVVHRHRNICSNLRPFQKEIAKYRVWARPFQPIRILDLLPLSHMFGQSQGLFIPLFLEGSVAFTSEIHPGKVIHFIHDNRISVVVCVPRILENLKNEVERRGIKAARVSGILRTMWRHRGTHRLFGWKFWSFVVGGAFVDRELEEFWKALGFAVIQGYGLTEASPVVAVNHPFDMRTGSLGKVVEGQDVQIAPDGEILVRGESVTTGDWLHTGDLGEIDSEGRLYYRGRKKELIVTPEGLNVHPEDVERVLNSFPEVRESAVVGTDQVNAVLILNDPNANIEALIRRANERLEAHQRIRSWSIWPGEDFPRTASTMKIKRYAISNPPPETGRAPLPDLSALSSLERVELLSELETRYQVELDEESFSKLQSPKELEDWLRRQCYDRGTRSRSAPLRMGPFLPFPLVPCRVSTLHCDSALSPLPYPYRLRTRKPVRAQRARPVRGQPHQPSRCPDDLHGVASRVAPAARSCNDEGPFPRLLRPRRTFVDRNSELRYCLLSGVFDLQRIPVTSTDAWHARRTRIYSESHQSRLLPARFSRRPAHGRRKAALLPPGNRNDGGPAPSPDRSNPSAGFI